MHISYNHYNSSILLLVIIPSVNSALSHRLVSPGPSCDSQRVLFPPVAARYLNSLSLRVAGSGHGRGPVPVVRCARWLDPLGHRPVVLA